MTITQNGGIFVADDNFGAGTCVFKRKLSQQWETLREMTSKNYIEHEEFLLNMLKLSPSIDDFQKVNRDFLKLKIIGKSEIENDPIYVDGEANTGYKINYRLENGNDRSESANAVLRDRFTLKVPYAKNSEKTYDLEVNIQYLNNGRDELRLRVYCPLIDKIEETAITDEVKEIEKKVKTASKMLVLSDF